MLFPCHYQGLPCVFYVVGQCTMSRGSSQRGRGLPGRCRHVSWPVGLSEEALHRARIAHRGDIICFDARVHTARQLESSKDDRVGLREEETGIVESGLR